MNEDARTLVVKDVGEIDTPLIVCGGAYSNLEAMTALFAAAAKLDIPPERIIHTGDVVAYCADPEATTELLKNSGALALLGNVEESLFIGADDCGCGFEEGTACDTLSAQWYSHADRQIGSGLRDWMKSLPHQIIFRCGDRRALVVHGNVTSINTFVFESLAAATFQRDFQKTTADIIIAGHTGLPFTRHFPGGRTWHNSGALGMPANDGTARVWYSIAYPDDQFGLRFVHKPLDYDHQTAARKMHEAGLPDAYANALVTGLWPNVDWLPEAERKQTGVRIDFELRDKAKGAAA